MSPQFQMVHVPPQQPIIDQFPLTPILSKGFERLVSVVECRGVLPTTWFAYSALVMPIVVWYTPDRVLWRWGTRLE